LPSSVLNKLVGKCIEKINLLGIKNKVKIAIDVDPQNML